MSLIRFLQRLWHAVREPFLLLRPIRFVVVPLALLLWALISSDEGQDAIRAVVEFDRRCQHWGAVLWFVLWVALLGLQAWYWSRQMLRIDFPQVGVVSTSAAGATALKSTAELADEYSGTQTWMPRILGISAFLIAIGALMRAAWLDYSGTWDYTTQVAAITIAMLLLTLLLFLVFVVFRRAKMGPARRVASQSELAGSTRTILGFTLAVAVLFVIWSAVSPLTAGVVFPSPTLLMFAAALWIGIGSWIVYWADMYRVPLVSTLVVLAIVFSYFNDNHAVRKLAANEGGGNIGARKSIPDTFDAWVAALRAKYPREARHPVYIVATEGGGIRAAYWTASVLTAIQDQAPHFADHVFAISGVSGGSVGATVFTALVADPNITATSSCAALNAPAKEKSLRFAAQQVLSYDFLAPTLASMLDADFAQRFLPIGFIPDRAKALETGWERGWRTHVRNSNGADDDFFSGGFVKMYAGNALLPSLFLNGTIVERGNRLIASNCLIDGNIPNSYDILDELGSDMRLSTAAHNSARFTYVSPAGSIRHPQLVDHVVDGGYFENSGAQTAADVIRALQSRVGADVNVNLILIRFQELDRSGKPLRLPPPERFMNETLSPIRALLNTRDARGTLAYAEAQQLVPAANRFEFLLTQQDGGIVLPLGWLLAQRSRNAIDVQVGTTVPPAIAPAIRPFVAQNVENVKKIGAQLAPAGPLLRIRRIAVDAVQQDAIASEASVK